MRSATITCVLLVIVGSSLKNCQSFRPDGTRDINLMVGCGFLGREVRKIESERMDVTVNANPQTNSVTITIYDSVAQFIALHFSYLRLRDSEYIVIRDADHSNQVIELGSANVSATVDDLYTRPLYTKHLVVDFFLAIPLQDIVQDKSGDGCYGFHIDHYRYFAQAFTYSTRMLENTCGVDDSQEVACLRVDRRVFQKSNSVIRLLVHKSTASVFCTGWLVGSEGHVMTNNHCIGTPKEAASTTFEFLAQGETCKDHCDHPLACKGTVEASSALLVAASPTQELDYALLLLNLSHEQRKSLVIKYGFLSMRATAPNLHENIYIPQHPQGFGKRIATKNQAQKGKILSTNITGCNLKNSSLGYALYTKGGSSGSPIISHVDHNVVGLHYCGGCLNSGIPAHLIIEDLEKKKSLPLNAVFGSLSKSLTNNPAKTVLETRWRIPAAVDGLVELDVLSFQYSEVMQQLNSVCDGSYFDSKIMLFQLLERSNIDTSQEIKKVTLFNREMVVIAANNDVAGKMRGTADKSMSDKDSYMRIFLPAGDYAVAIGPNSFTAEEVMSGRRARIENETHPLYHGGVPGADHGNYILTFRSTEFLQVNFNRSRYTSWTASK